MAQPSDPAPAQALPTALRRAAAARLVGGPGPVGRRAAERFLQTAPSFGIDLELLFGVGEGEAVRQVCLAVPGAGRTAMLFLSGPGPEAACGSVETQHTERVASVRAALEGLERMRPGALVLAQALPEPKEGWAIRALGDAGMTLVGDLAYLRRPMEGLAGLGGGDWPAGVDLEPVGDLDDPVRRARLGRALDRSYIDTLDCPALCGMRATEDVIEGHRATGVFDPSRWWLVTWEGEAEGCCLMSHCPDHRSVELVYIGLGPGLRGQGVGRRVLEHALGAVSGVEAVEVTCAVDRSNTPALRLYEGLGFSEFTSRVAFVAPIGGHR